MVPEKPKKTQDISSKAECECYGETVGARRHPRRFQDSPYNNSPHGPKQPESRPEIAAYHADSYSEAMDGKTGPEKPEISPHVACKAESACRI